MVRCVAVCTGGIEMKEVLLSVAACGVVCVAVCCSVYRGGGIEMIAIPECVAV